MILIRQLRNRFSALTLAACLAGTLFGPPAEAGAKLLPIRPTVLVQEGRVDASALLGPEASRSLREALAKIPMGSIPAPLGWLSIERKDLQQRLGSFAGLFSLPSRVQIIRRGDLLPGNEIGEKIREDCRDRFGELETQGLELDLTRLPNHIVLPGPLQSWTIKPMSTNKLGMLLYSVEAVCEGGTPRQIVQVELSRVVKAARVSKLAKPGEILTPDLLTEETVRLKSQPAVPPVTYEEALNQTLCTIKSPGTFIRRSDLDPGPTAVSAPRHRAAKPLSGDDPLVDRLADGEPDGSTPDVSGIRPTDQEPLAADGETVARRVPPIRASSPASKPRKDWIIRPGDKVDFQVLCGGLSLTVPAKALQGGAVGETIKLMNLQNSRQITGVITAEGKVEYGQN